MDQNPDLIQDEHESTALTVRLIWGRVEDIPTVYANHLMISHAGPEFYLIFGEVSPPAMLGKDEVPEHIEIKPVAKIALAPEAMLNIVEAIEANVEKYLTKSERAMEGESDDNSVDV
jgi:hypothetical protein